jgi:hypothetical protein
MALSLTWGGRVDTDIAFSEFFSGNHTVTARFMLQFVNVYTGPMIAVHGSGVYFIGNGDGGGGNNKISIRIGSQIRYTAAWVPGTGGEYQIYDAPYTQYRARYDELWPQGWRLKLIDVIDVNGAPSYTAAWYRRLWASTRSTVRHSRSSKHATTSFGQTAGGSSSSRLTTQVGRASPLRGVNSTSPSTGFTAGSTPTCALDTMCCGSRAGGLSSSIASPFDRFALMVLHGCGISQWSLYR